ncbi:copper amine oxidase N-terminal domain-containing protein [Gracilibacillus boraciitolerans]|nr:copper amine oxidase N-terminal domain-containing protein [Gracilibacillus boraciitolerans]
MNNRYQTIDAAPEIRNGTTFIPIRFVTENLGAQVNYYEATKEIEIIF